MGACMLWQRRKGWTPVLLLQHRWSFTIGWRGGLAGGSRRGKESVLVRALAVYRWNDGFGRGTRRGEGDSEVWPSEYLPYVSTGVVGGGVAMRSPLS
ncbi:hypothetical protein Tco_0836567 [Tanacetum coccineum]